MFGNNKKGFGIVEGMVAMALFGTIGFISLQGYSADARNSKILSDVNNIQSAISIKMAEGGGLMAFVDKTDDNRLSELSLAGSDATQENYTTGIPNYTALGVRREEFISPAGYDYAIATTTTGNGRFQLSAVLEGDYGDEAFLKGTYVGRNNTMAEISRIDQYGNIILDGYYTNGFRSGDRVIVDGDEYNISKVARDGVTITVEGELPTDSKFISLVESEGEGLISDYFNNQITVTHGSTNALPY